MNKGGNVMKIRWFVVLFVLMITFAGFGQKQEYPYAEDIRQFRINDSINPPPHQVILFIGSSSFTIWKDVQDYFPGYVILNRGFGGSTILDQIHYYKDVIFAYDPKQVVIYCGENDLVSGQMVTGKMVYQRFISLFYIIRAQFPKAKITYISMKPSPSRWDLRAKMLEGNNMIRDFLIKQKNTSFISVWDDMLGPNQRPKPEIFLPDSLHMNADGYRIWQKLIEPELVQ
jgi:lysophospholipase L1-like esterase